MILETGTDIRVSKRINFRFIIKVQLIIHFTSNTKSSSSWEKEEIIIRRKENSILHLKKTTRVIVNALDDKNFHLKIITTIIFYNPNEENRKTS